MFVYTFNEYRMFNLIKLEKALVATFNNLNIIFKWPVPELSTENKNNPKNDYYV